MKPEETNLKKFLSQMKKSRVKVPYAAEWVRVTPQLARLILDTMNLSNRAESPEKVKRLAGFMVDGHWIEQGDAICFSVDWVLLDGQGRLAAVEESGKPVNMLFITGLHPMAFLNKDTGQRREIRHHIQRYFSDQGWYPENKVTRRQRADFVTRLGQWFYYFSHHSERKPLPHLVKSQANCGVPMSTLYEFMVDNMDLLNGIQEEVFPLDFRKSLGTDYFLWDATFFGFKAWLRANGQDESFMGDFAAHALGNVQCPYRSPFLRSQRAVQRSISHFEKHRSKIQALAKNKWWACVLVRLWNVYAGGHLTEILPYDSPSLALEEWQTETKPAVVISKCKGKKDQAA